MSTNGHHTGLPADMCERSAYFSDCGQYRYWLRRDLDMFNRRALLGMLMNPSKAGHVEGDPTTTVMCGFARRNAFGLYGAVNMKAWIETDSTKLSNNADEIGPLNDVAIRMALAWVDAHDGRVLTAFGAYDRLGTRAEEVLEMLKGRKLLRFGVNADGSPRFPRAISKDTRLEEWTA